MEHIFIISYIYPPCDKTGAARALAMARYLHAYGYYPTVLTRNWDYPVKEEIDCWRQTGEKIVKKEYDSHEEIYFPYHGNFRTRFKVRHESRFSGISKILFFLDHLLLCMGIYRFSEYSMFSKYLKKYFKHNNDVAKIIIIGAPFYPFYFGYWLKKRFGVRWIADYRDAWTTSEIEGNKFLSFFHRILYRLEHLAEKRWVSTASYVTSVTKPYTDGISQYVNVPGVTVMNGYLEEDVEKIERITPVCFNGFTIFHNGTLYPTQIEGAQLFLDGFKKFIDDNKGIKIKVLFIGIKFWDGVYQKMEEAMVGYEEYYEMTHRIPKENLLNTMMRSQVCLMITHGKDNKGVASSKIFDYMLSAKPVLCCPSDNDIVQRLLQETKQGIFCETVDQVYDSLEKLTTGINGCDKKITNFDLNAVRKYSRKNQTAIFGELLQMMGQTK